MVLDGEGSTLPGLYAAGECACVSVHGANRLGTNSLVDIVVFGRRMGIHAREYIRGVGRHPSLPDDPEGWTRDRLQGLLDAEATESAADIRREMQQVMMQNVGVFRTDELMTGAIEKVEELKVRYPGVGVQDMGMRFNTELMEAFELGSLLDLAHVTAVSARNRTESRGAHSRDDFPDRDDENWLKHTLAYQEEAGWRIDHRPVVITRFEPKERTY